jgi:hypothetical protein
MGGAILPSLEKDKLMVASRQTRLKLRKGYQNAPLTYTVLMVGQFTVQDEKEIAKGLVIGTTPEKAKKLLPTPIKKTKWSLKPLMLVGNYDAHLLQYKGLEVALYFRRQVSIVTPEACDPAPEGVLQNPDDVWARIDLFQKSPRQLVGTVTAELESKDREIIRLNYEIEAKDALLSADEHTMKSLRGQLMEATQTHITKKNRASVRKMLYLPTQTKKGKSK